MKDWHVETGEFEILIGKSSKEIVLNDRIHVQSTVLIRKPVHRNTLLGDLFSDPLLAPIAKELMAKATEYNPMFNMTEIESEASEMMTAMVQYMPLRALAGFSQGMFTEEMLNGMIEKLNNNLVNC